MESDLICLFSSHYSFGGSSILTVDEPEKDEVEINENKPVSIFSIAKKYKLKNIYIAEKSFSGLVDSYNAAEKLDVNLRFGFKVICCADINDKSENSFNSEHKIIIWLKNGNGYKNLVKLASKAQTDGFYYIPRIDYDLIKEFWSDDLIISIPFYDSFIHKNLLEFGQCVPKFPARLVLFLESNDLPIDFLLEKAVKDYASAENYEILNTKSVYYYRYVDFKAFLVNRCINNRSTFEKPEFRGMCSNRFCFEDYLILTGKNILK